MIHVSSKVLVYEIDGKEVNPHRVGQDDATAVHVLSHWNYSNRVILGIGSYKLTVLAKDLEAAIANARNNRR